jgi:hypothetical protein
MEAAVILSFAMVRSLDRYSAAGAPSQTVRLGHRLQARRAASGALLACAFIVLGCAAALQPCRSPGACPPGSECLADRCVPLGAEPVAPDTLRRVLDPVAVAVVRREARPQSALPPTVLLGGPAGKSEMLLVRFPHPGGELDIDAAFLLLEPAVDAEPSGDDVPIEVVLVGSGWSSGILADAPSSHGTVSAGLGRTRPPAILRVDVTAQLRELAKQPRSEQGWLVRGAHASPRGAIYSTGIDGVAPRLDVYFTPRRAR